ncbi:MAG: hypothetical protein ACI82F_003781, partial [Planctomycetota bacterium]
MIADLDQDGDGMINAAEAAENKSVLSRADADGEGDHPLRIFFRFLDEDKDRKLTESEWPKLARWSCKFDSNGDAAGESCSASARPRSPVLRLHRHPAGP